MDKPISRTAKEVKSFFGAISYFRKHTKNFAAIAALLYNLDKGFKWKQKHTDAFETMKTTLINAAVLSPPDNTKNYTIFNDASFQGLGVALTQQGRSIAFASRSLKAAEKNYLIIKLEALGLVYALKQFRSYIYGKHTLVITDHKPLLSLLKNKKLESILQRYQIAIMEYDLTIQYLKEKDNAVADYLSRNDFLSINTKEKAFKNVFPDHEGRLAETTKRHLPEAPGNWVILNADYMQVDNEYILVIVDEYSKFVYAVVTKNQNRPTTRLQFSRCFTTLGFPLILRTDNGLTFILQSVKDYTKSVGIEQQFGSPYNHRSNACVERFNRTLREAICVELYHFIYAYNKSKHLTTGIFPATLLLNIPDHLTNKDTIHNGFCGILQIYNITKIELKDEGTRRHGIQIQTNDLVMKKVLSKKDNSTSNKNQSTWNGSYRVIQCLYGDTYEIEKLNKTRKTRQNIEKIHGDMLKLYISQQYSRKRKKS